jgi:hypothetical protein
LIYTYGSATAVAASVIPGTPQVAVAIGQGIGIRSVTRGIVAASAVGEVRPATQRIVQVIAGQAIVSIIAPS